MASHVKRFCCWTCDFPQWGKYKIWRCWTPLSIYHYCKRPYSRNHIIPNEAAIGAPQPWGHRLSEPWNPSSCWDGNYAIFQLVWIFATPFFSNDFNNSHAAMYENHTCLAQLSTEGAGVAVNGISMMSIMNKSRLASHICWVWWWPWLKLVPAICERKLVYSSRYNWISSGIGMLGCCLKSRWWISRIDQLAHAECCGETRRLQCRYGAATLFLVIKS